MLGKDGPGGVTFNNQGPFNVANRGQNFPVISSTAGNVISVTFNAEASKTYRLEFFASDAADPTNFGEGQTFLGFVNKTTDGAGNTPPFTFTSPIDIAGKFISATATDSAGNTSEFSGAVEAASGGCSTVVTNTNNSGLGSLRAAIDCANSTPGAQTITIPAGTYVLAGARGENLNVGGDLDITDDLTLVGAGAATTIIDGAALDRIFDILSPAGAANVNALTQVTIRGLTIRNGRVADNGGGVRSVGVLTLANSTVTGNTATFRPNLAPEPPSSSSGGGVAALRTPVTQIAFSSLIVTNCTITNNTANNGGGIFGGSSGGQDTMRVTGTAITGNRTLIVPGGSARADGAGGLCNGGLLVMTNCTVTGNTMPATADGEGGGFASEGGDSVLTDCSFDNNVAGNGGGGGFENAGGNLTLLRCNFRNNTCGSDSGGGFENEGGDLTMTDCTVTGNRSTSPAMTNDGGGGFENEGGSLVMTRCNISNNSVTGAGRPNADGTIGGQGGGGFENEGGPLTMTDCTVANNMSDGPGGGIYNQGGAVTLLRCTISGNSTPANGGGINLDGGDGTFTNCTISGNTAGEEGGGISDINGGNFLNVTFALNRAASGGAIYQEENRSGIIVFKNTILNSTAGGNYTEGTGQPRVQSQGGNISSDATLAAFFTRSGDKNSTDPRLDVLKSNGGLTQTHALLPGSPAIDGGLNAGAPTTDQRGTARPIDGDRNGTATVDSGAFEAPPAASLPTISVNDVTITEGNTGTTNAVFTLTLSRAANGPVTVNFATRDNEAVAPGDYTAVNRTVTIPAGQTTATVSVPVVGDNIEENNELFTVVLTNPQGATLAKAQGNGTILNNDTATISINDVRLAEGNTGTKNFVFTVSLSNASAFANTVNFATANGSATAGSDYVARSGAVTFAAGQTTDSHSRLS